MQQSQKAPDWYSLVIESQEFYELTGYRMESIALSSKYPYFIFYIFKEFTKSDGYIGTRISLLILTILFSTSLISFFLFSFYHSVLPFKEILILIVILLGGLFIINIGVIVFIHKCFEEYKDIKRYKNKSVEAIYQAVKKFNASVILHSNGIKVQKELARLTNTNFFLEEESDFESHKFVRNELITTIQIKEILRNNQSNIEKIRRLYEENLSSFQPEKIHEIGSQISNDLRESLEFSLEIRQQIQNMIRKSRNLR